MVAYMPIPTKTNSKAMMLDRVSLFSASLYLLLFLRTPLYSVSLSLLFMKLQVSLLLQHIPPSLLLHMPLTVYCISTPRDINYHPFVPPLNTSFTCPSPTTLQLINIRHRNLTGKSKGKRQHDLHISVSINQLYLLSVSGIRKALSRPTSHSSLQSASMQVVQR